MAQRTKQHTSSMAGTGVSGSSSSSSASHQAVPKILLAKPGLVSAGKFNRGSGGGGGTDDDSVLRSRLPSIGSVNLLSESWDFSTDRFLPFLTDNTDFMVVGVIGPPGVGKSTIMNEIYGFDATSPGMLPPFPIQSEETRAMAKHCTVGIEPRISSERIILLDTQPVFSASILSEIMKPDGSSAISVITGESLSAELAYELMNIQVDLLKHNIPDPSSVTLSHPQGSGLGPEKEKKDTILDAGKEYMASPVFVHTKLRARDITPHSVVQLNRALGKYFSSASFMRSKIDQNASRESICSSPAIMTENTQNNDLDSALPMLFLIPSKSGDDSSKPQYESYICALWRLRDQVLSMSNPSFSRTVSERDWLKNSAKIWDIIKTSSTVTDYYRTLHASGMFRR